MIAILIGVIVYVLIAFGAYAMDKGSQDAMEPILYPILVPFILVFLALIPLIFAFFGAAYIARGDKSLGFIKKLMAKLEEIS